MFRERPNDRWVGDGFEEHDRRIEYFVKHAPSQNFGDYLPELFCKELLLHAKVDADVFRLVGSVIEERWIRRDLRRANGAVIGKVAFWGCGMRKAEPLSAAARAHCLFFGVRGPLTRDLLGLADDTVLGDPGLLAPLLHAPRLPVSPQTICIPHIHDDKTDEELLGLSGADRVVRPSVKASEEDLRRLLDEIAAAEFVLTGSLHGAIVASAYGRPFAFWDTGHVDIPFKWRDFAESVHIPATFARDLEHGRRIHREEIAPRLRLPPLTPILDACPFQVRPSQLIRASIHDGRLAPGHGEVAMFLDALPSAQLSSVLGLQRETASVRADRSRPASMALSAAGRAANRMKRYLDQVAGR